MGAKREYEDGGRSDDEAVDDRDNGEDWAENAVLMDDGARVGPHTFVEGVWYGTAGESADVSSYWLVKCDTTTMPSSGVGWWSFAWYLWMQPSGDKLLSSFEWAIFYNTCATKVGNYCERCWGIVQVT